MCRCIYCFAPRPSDPYARFCNECGNAVPPIPQNRIAPPEPGQVLNTIVIVELTSLQKHESGLKTRLFWLCCVSKFNKLTHSFWQMGTCVHCKSTVPFNAPNCLVCEAPMSPQNQPMASVLLQQKAVCPECFTANPPNVPSCITCEARLGMQARVSAFWFTGGIHQ